MRDNLIKYSSDKEDGQSDVSNELLAIPLVLEDQPLEVLGKEEKLVNHVWDRSESTLDN